MQERAEKNLPEWNGVMGPNMATEPETKKIADVIDIKRAALEAAEKELNDFADYKALKTGHLTLAEYQRAKNAVKTAGAEINETLLASARVAANLAGITLSPEALALYSMLRSDPNISSKLLDSDQQRLAEVLRIMGRTEDLQKLVAKHPHIKF